MTVQQLRKILKGLPQDMEVFFEDEDENLIGLCHNNVSFTEIDDSVGDEEGGVIEAIIFGECQCECDLPPIQSTDNKDIIDSLDTNLN